MKNLFEMLQAIFGKNIISKTIGTRTNVIKLPSNKSSPLKNEFNPFCNLPALIFNPVNSSIAAEISFNKAANSSIFSSFLILG